jgi:peptidoglycan hydrolase-like protein with peptidoglycan-binding domain
MKKITQGSLLAVLVSVGLASSAFAFTIINQQLDLGERNADVTSLQEFLASDSSVYTQGLVTGFFGPLTKSAVMNFQAKYGISQAGRVGPQTLAKINSMIGSGVANASGPAIVMQYLPQITATSATFNWMTTNGVALGRLYYSTQPLRMNEGNINSEGFAVTTGQLGSYDGLARSSQSSSITGLQPNTIYYYTIVATDLGGNVSVIGPNDTFRTASQ